VLGKGRGWRPIESAAIEGWPWIRSNDGLWIELDQRNSMDTIEQWVTNRVGLTKLHGYMIEQWVMDRVGSKKLHGYDRTMGYE
jgi:hypothetical protein